MVKGKARAAAVIRVPQSKEEARDMMAEYGNVLREIEHVETNLNQALADIKKQFVDTGAPLAAKADDLFKGLQTYCDANRATLTDNGAIKSVDFGTGKVSWRWNPASVKLPRDADKLEALIERIIKAGEDYADFLRTTVEINKVAMLRDPNRAKKIEGVKIAPSGETFTAEPFAAEQLAETV